MSTQPRMMRSTRSNWLLSGLEGGLVLSVAGFLLLNLNPFWNLNGAGSLDPRAEWWNFGGEGLTAIGLLMLSLALVGCAAALVSRCVPTRPLWPYFVAALVVAGMLTWLGLDGFTREFQADFQWNAADGFSAFELNGSTPSGNSSTPPANLIWTSIVSLQVQPQLRGHFHVIDWVRVKGHTGITVVRIVPIAWPLALGAEGETLEDPDETPLMQAAEKNDLPTVQQLLAAKADVNARDQSSETALIHACRNPKVAPTLVRALLTAGADVNIRSRNGYTALAWATARSNDAVMQLLRRSGARP
jgi:hypothetical protein